MSEKKQIKKDEIYLKLGSFKYVENMASTRGSATPNQFILWFENGQVFQSYKSIIAVKFNAFKSVDNPYYLGSDWEFSQTTGKYRNAFLNSNKKSIINDLKNGVAVLMED